VRSDRIDQRSLLADEQMGALVKSGNFAAQAF
jgi:hypothetical protein